MSWRVLSGLPKKETFCERLLRPIVRITTLWAKWEYLQYKSTYFIDASAGGNTGTEAREISS